VPATLPSRKRAPPSIRGSTLASPGVTWAPSALDASPPSLARFVKSEEFQREVHLLATRTTKDPKEIEAKLISFLAVAPRRSTGDLSPTDWRRLLDVFRVISED